MDRAQVKSFQNMCCYVVHANYGFKILLVIKINALEKEYLSTTRNAMRQNPVGVGENFIYGKQNK